MDLFGAGLVKYVEERALAPYIGNATIKSGAIKLGIGLGARRFAGKGLVGDSLSLGFGVDGVEDILNGVFSSGMVPGIGDRTGGEW